MSDRDSIGPELEQLLGPVSAAEPCGPSIRYEPAFLALRQAREEDDPTLPMREWERPLKKADWRGVSRSAVEMLARSKDLLLAGWLTEAWTRLHQIAGFNAGADLLAGLVERHWDHVHPQIEDGDTDARVAPFAWMNESLALTLRLHVPLMVLADHPKPFVSLADWEQIVTPRPGREEREGEEVLTREQLIGMADTRAIQWLSQLQADLVPAQEKWDALARSLDERLALDAPSIGKVADTLRKLQRACASLLDGRDPRAAPPRPAPQEPQYAPEIEEVTTMSAGYDQPPQEAAAAPLASGPIASRQDAYRMLEAAAAYLERTEPHSPTPYLVKRAVSWGQMSLADLMQEILREEGDLSRYFALLGMNVPRE